MANTPHWKLEPLAQRLAALAPTDPARAWVCERHPAVAAAVARVEARDFAAQLGAAGLGSGQVLELVGQRVERAPRSVRRWLTVNAG